MEYRVKLLSCILLASVVCGQTCAANAATQRFVWDAPTSVSGAVLSALTCVKDTQIDFTTPQTTNANLPVTSLTGGATTYQYLSFTNNGGALLQFLNRDGVNQSYSLTTVSLSKYSAGARMQIVNAPVAPDYGMRNRYIELSFTFENAATSEKVALSVMLLNSATTVPTSAQHVIRPTATSSYPGLQGLYDIVKNLQGVAGTLFGVSSLSLFNQLDLSQFFTAQDTINGCKTNYLVNRFVYQLPSTSDVSFTGSPYINPTSYTQAATGNLLCWGSNTNLGTVSIEVIQFQTHMRDNYGLWVAWWTALFFWGTLLIGEATTHHSLTDPHFSDNRWTCWGMYSLWHLAHEEFFSRMLRTVPMFICFWWQACIIAVLYERLSSIWPTPTNIPLFGLGGWFFSLPLQWAFGGFTKQIYQAYGQKYQYRLKIKGIRNKESEEVRTLEESMDAIDLKIYNSYYWMYLMGFALFVVFVTITINRLQELPRELYYQQQYWLAALGVAWFFDNFVADPLLSLLLGNTEFYRFRPYYYDSKLGETFKELEA